MTSSSVGPDQLIAGRYRLLSRIGGGGMGAVWAARDELLGRPVAVKQVLPPAGADPQESERQRQRALREGRIAARLSHPHAISIYDVAEEAGQPWLVMEHLPSRSLAEVLAEDGLLRVDQVAQIGAQVADALAATHAAGIVHRDVKPANILIGEGDRVEGLVKITDFGISHARGDVTLTRTGQITGTPAFLSPEVARGEEPTPASDVFSLAATLYTCLEGQPPFGMSDNALQQLHRVAGGEIIPPQRCGGMTRPLLAMLATDPAARPSMGAVRDDLAALAAPDGDTTTVLMARADLRSSAPGRQRTAAFEAPRPADRTRRKAPGLWVLGGALVTLAVVLGAVWLANAGGPDGSPPAPGAGTSAAAPSTPTTAGTTGPAATTTSEPAPTTPASASSAAPVNAKDVRDLLRQYHRLVIEDPEAAWAMTGPTLRSSIGHDGYIRFWSQFSEVKLSGLEVPDGALTASGRLEYRFRDGQRRREQHRFTLVVGDDGRLLLDSDTRV